MVTILNSAPAIEEADLERTSAVRDVGGVTVRSLVIAFALVILITPLSFYVEVRWVTMIRFASGAPTSVPITVLFLLAAVAGSRLLARFGLSRRELLVIYIILAVGVPLGSRAALFYAIPKAAVYHLMMPQYPLWQVGFARYIPSWWAPTSAAAIKSLESGHTAVPWQAWFLPWGAWSFFMLALWGATVSILLLFQKQWITHEALSFPIAQIPLGLTVKPAPGQADIGGRLPSAALFWGGLIIAFGLTFVGSLSRFLPFLPAIQMSGKGLTVWRYRELGPLQGIGELYLPMSPWVISLFYLIPAEISFSVWFFWAGRLALNVLVLAAGGNPEGMERASSLAYSYQAAGAAVAIALWFTWVARRHLAGVLRAAFSRRPYDREAALYRWAVICLAACFIYMIAFCMLSGCRLVFALVMLGLLVGYYVLWARVRAEVGIAFLIVPTDIADMMAAPFGYSVFRPREIITLVTMRWAAYSWVSSDTTLALSSGGVLESLKIADAAGIDKKRLTGAIVPAFVIALVAGGIMLLYGLYHYGFFGTEAGAAPFWPGWPMRRDGDDILTYIATPPPAQGLNSAIAAAAGIVVVAVLAAMRLNFLWWPLHPIGYFIGCCYGAPPYLLAFIIAWVIKVSVVKLGGFHLYRKSVPLAIGFITGDMINLVLWNMVTLVTGGVR